MNNELERMWTETAVRKFKVVHWNLCGGTKKNHEIKLKVASLCLVSEPVTS
jgi:hypothetical protein